MLDILKTFVYGFALMGILSVVVIAIVGIINLFIMFPYVFPTLIVLGLAYAFGTVVRLILGNKF